MRKAAEFAHDFHGTFLACSEGIENIVWQIMFIFSASHFAVIVKWNEDIGLALDVKEIILHVLIIHAVGNNVIAVIADDFIIVLSYT